MSILALLLALALTDEKEVEEAIQKFKSAMRSPDVGARVVAVTDLGRTQHERILKVLGSCLQGGDPAVRIAAAAAVSSYEDRRTQASSILAEALGANAKEAKVQVAVFTALKKLHDESFLGIAYRYIDDKNAEVAEAAIQMTETLHSRHSIDPLIRLIKKLQTAGEGITGGNGGYDVPADEQLRQRARRLQAAAEKALQAITGQSLSTPQEWDSWWKKNSATFRIKN